MANILKFLKSRRKKGREQRFADSLRRFDHEAQTTISNVQPYTMLDPDKLFALIEAARYLHRHDIEGAIVECGVWRGGAVMAVAMTFARAGDLDRNFYLYDTFTGMTKPTEEDQRLPGAFVPPDKSPQQLFQAKQTGPDSSDWCRAGLQEVAQNLATVGYERNRFITIEGKVEDTIPGHLSGDIALLHLDTDWYASTRHELLHLFPRLVSKGVLVVDDYANWSGARKALDEYLEESGVPILLNRVSDSVVAVRP